ncbi:hypothetical protein Cni_G23342 [Canna indica]|uniref:Uncharacterized protein n=1 Tax=Canna indica TaxID=4628 RepID=A0AAQ3KSZ1_9LILI|nr:hypothetical protein Cni_G23342 [Canna indica]
MLAAERDKEESDYLRPAASPFEGCEQHEVSIGDGEREESTKSQGNGLHIMGSRRSLWLFYFPKGNILFALIPSFDCHIDMFCTVGSVVLVLLM